MESALVCLILLLLMVVSGVISRFIPSLPTPIIQISLGAFIASFFSSFSHWLQS